MDVGELLAANKTKTLFTGEPKLARLIHHRSSLTLICSCLQCRKGAMIIPLLTEKFLEDIGGRIWAGKKQSTKSMEARQSNITGQGNIRELSCNVVERLVTPSSGKQLCRKISCTMYYQNKSLSFCKGSRNIFISQASIPWHQFVAVAHL